MHRNFVIYSVFVFGHKINVGIYNLRLSMFQRNFINNTSKLKRNQSKMSDSDIAKWDYWGQKPLSIESLSKPYFKNYYNQH